ncbi:MAG: hypothetical protein G3I10_02185 [Ferrovum sp.]|nr:hypothetical protein [Ferrovum sp.]
MQDIGKKHRVIGIRHVLRRLKKAGLVEEESLYANEAVEDVQNRVLAKVLTWYKIGARRGALVVLDAILDGKLTVRERRDGSREVIAKVKDLRWRKKLRVKVGKDSHTLKERTYSLTTEELEFENG